MKNYITVAALLAAGTAFANADVVAVFNCGGSDATSSQWMDQDQSGWTLAQMGDGGNESESFTDVTSGSGIKLSLSASVGVLSRTGPAGSFSANAADGTNPYPIPSDLTNLSSGVLGDDYNTLWGGSVNMWNAGSATLTLGGLKANTEYTVYLFSARANAHNSGNGGSVTWESTTSANWSVWTVADNAATKAEGSNTVLFDGDSSGKNASIVEVTFTTGANQTSVSFSTGESQRFTLNGIVVDQGQTIPEPSAFGLLAGLGALALVASRRRRK